MATSFTFDLNKEFDPDWEEDSSQRLFSSLPDQEKTQVDQAVVESGVRTLQSEGSYMPAKEGKGRLTSTTTGNPLDDFEAPVKQVTPTIQADAQEEEDASLGKIIAGGYDLISKIKMVQAGRTGRNAREVAREKALDNQAIYQVYSAVQSRLSERGYDPSLVDVLGTRPGGGFRNAQDIDRLFKIKQEGLTFQTEDGRTARLDPDAPWEAILEADRKTSGIKIQAAAGDPVEEVNKINTALKAISDENGNPLQGREAEYESLTSRKDARLGLPTGVSLYSDRYSRLSDRERKLNLALANGVNFGDISKDSIPQELANINEQKITLAIERAPTFNMTDPADKARMQDWLSKNETKSLPFNAILSDGAGTFQPTGKENVYRRWSPIEKQWKIADFNKPQPTATSEEPETNSEFSKAGRTGQKIRQAAGKLAGVTEAGVARAGAAVADLLPLSVNTGASVIEGAAGVFDTPLNLPRMDYLEERAKKNKLGKYRDK